MKAAALAGAVLLTALLAAVSTAVSTAGPASAHTALRSATPAIGATVRPPDRVVLTFTDPVQFTEVVVIDDARRHYESGRPSSVDGTVTQGIGTVLPDGRYTVAWRVVAPDGHPIKGSHRFNVTGSTAAAAAAGSAPATAPAAPPGATAAVEPGEPGEPAGASHNARLWWVVLAVFAATGIGIAALRFGRRARTGARSPAGSGSGTGSGSGR